MSTSDYMNQMLGLSEVTRHDTYLCIDGPAAGRRYEFPASILTVPVAQEFRYEQLQGDNRTLPWDAVPPIETFQYQRRKVHDGFMGLFSVWCHSQPHELDDPIAWMGNATWKAGGNMDEFHGRIFNKWTLAHPELCGRSQLRRVVFHLVAARFFNEDFVYFGSVRGNSNSLRCTLDDAWELIERRYPSRVALDVNVMRAGENPFTTNFASSMTEIEGASLQRLAEIRNGINCRGTLHIDSREIEGNWQISTEPQPDTRWQFTTPEEIRNEVDARLVADRNHMRASFNVGINREAMMAVMGMTEADIGSPPTRRQQRYEGYERPERDENSPVYDFVPLNESDRGETYYDHAGAWDPNNTSHDATSQNFELVPTETCWRNVNDRECGGEPDPDSPSGLCAKHSAEMRSRYADDDDTPKRSRLDPLADVRFR